METSGDKGLQVVERTVPDEIADLPVEVRAMFLRVEAGLFPSEAPQPEKVGRYELEGRRLGGGGMGSVYRAWDPGLGRHVAIKLVSPRSLMRPQKLGERLRQEALTLAKFQHPNIVTIFDGGVDQGRVFLAMELVEGETLYERQQHPNCSFEERLRLYVEAGRGLAAAHDRGVVHRDFKPDNVFVDEDGRARVGDFGLAYVLGTDEIEDTPESTDSSPTRERLTQTGEFLGTPGYSAPEQLRREKTDARSDQYAFCVSVWEALCGEKPYDGSREQLLEAMERGEPRGGEKLPGRLRRALLVGMSAQPQRRYGDMNAVIRVLERELQRPERMRRRFSFGTAGVLGLSGIFALVVSHGALDPACPLAEALDEHPSTDAWSSFAAALPSSASRFEALLEVRAAQARAICANETSDLAREQQLRAVQRRLDALPSYAPDRYDEYARELERALLAGSTQPLSSEVEAFLADELEPLEARDFDPHDADRWFEDIIAASTRALEEHARTPVDQAELRLRRGRAHLQHAEPELAVADFREAWALAEEGLDYERRLQAYLEYARALIMRLEEVERGRDFVYSAQKLLEGIDESILSERRATADELDARLARHDAGLARHDGGLAPDDAESDAKFAEALSLQRRAVWRDLLAGRFYDLVRRFTNLAIIHEVSGNPRMAASCYRAALHLDPTDLEARFNLGRLLVNEPELFDRADEARELLDGVLASGHSDTRLPAAVSALQLEIQLEDSTLLARRRADLVELLESNHPGMDSHIVQGWCFVVLAYAIEGELGPGFEAALRQLLPLLDEDLRAELEAELAHHVGAEQAGLLLQQMPASP